MQQFGAGVPEYDDDGYFYYGDESQEDFVSPEYAPEPYDMGINLQHPSEIDNMEQQPGMWTETLAVASDNSSSKVASGCFDEELEMYWVGTESGRVIGFECPVMEKHCAFHAHNNAVTAMTTINQVSFFMSLLLILKVGLFTGSTDSVRLFTKGGCHVMRHQFVLFSNFQVIMVDFQLILQVLNAFYRWHVLLRLFLQQEASFVCLTSLLGKSFLKYPHLPLLMLCVKQEMLYFAGLNLGYITTSHIPARYLLLTATLPFRPKTKEIRQTS